MHTLIRITAIALATLAGCAQPDRPAAPPPPGLPAGSAPQATATLKSADGREAGRVLLTEASGAVHVQVEAVGLSAGPHGFHVHANGACAPGPDAATGQVVAFGAAGGHFDPGATRNHGHPDDPVEHAHAGELPNVVADGAGRAVAHVVKRGVTLQPGKTSIMGRTLVIHAEPDDYRTDPAGNSGPRVLCGVVEPSSHGVVKARTTLKGTNVFPEGVAVDAHTGDRYVGSSKEGHLYRFAAGATEAEIFQAGGSPGRQGAFGLKVDDRRRLWVAGGPNGTLAAVDLATATTRVVLKAPPGQQSFLNDLVVSGGHVYVTDSFRPVVYRVALDAATPSLEPWLDLNGTPVRYLPNEVNLNGIVASPDGRWLMAVQLSTGQLWRIDVRTRAVSEVRVEGGSLLHGDGLVLRGSTELYVVRNEEAEVARVDLAGDWSSGRVTQRLRDPRFRYPTTAALVPEGLLLVNGQLDKQKEPPPLLPFDIVAVDLPR